jgi:alpha-soluble NSF attachment protein
MPPRSPADGLIEKATKRFDGAAKGGWLSFGSSSSSKFEEAGDLYQQAANQYKIDRDFKSAGDAFSKEAECRERAGEANDAANAWWNAAKAYKQSSPDRAFDLHCNELPWDI